MVGIWHETYAVPAGGHESVYVGMPITGLAAATTSLPIAQSNGRHATLEQNARAPADLGTEVRSRTSGMMVA